MDASCKVQENIHLCCLVNKYVSRILGTYHKEQFIHSNSISAGVYLLATAVCATDKGAKTSAYISYLNFVITSSFAFIAASSIPFRSARSCSLISSCFTAIIWSAR